MGQLSTLPRRLGPENSLCNFMKRHRLLVEGWEGHWPRCSGHRGALPWTWRWPRGPAIASGDAPMSQPES